MNKTRFIALDGVSFAPSSISGGRSIASARKTNFTPKTPHLDRRPVPRGFRPPREEGVRVNLLNLAAVLRQCC